MRRTRMRANLTIRKSAQDLRLPPHLADYTREWQAFSWAAAVCAVDVLPCEQAGGRQSSCFKQGSGRGVYTGRPQIEWLWLSVAQVGIISAWARVLHAVLALCNSCSEGCVVHSRHDAAQSAECTYE